MKIVNGDWAKRVYYNNVRTIHNITSLAADSNGNLYFTEPQGLHRYDPRSNNDDLIVSTWGNGRFLNVAVDKNDRVWFSTTSEFIQMYDVKKGDTMYIKAENVSCPMITQLLNDSSYLFTLFKETKGFLCCKKALRIPQFSTVSREKNFSGFL